MQTNKTILRNSEIVIFDKKNNFVATWVSFLSTHWIGNSFFFHVSLISMLRKLNWFHLTGLIMLVLLM